MVRHLFTVGSSLSSSSEKVPSRGRKDPEMITDQSLLHEWHHSCRSGCWVALEILGAVAVACCPGILASSSKRKMERQTKGCLAVIAYRRACRSGHESEGAIGTRGGLLDLELHLSDSLSGNRMLCVYPVQRRSTNNWSNWRHLICNLTDVSILMSFTLQKQTKSMIELLFMKFWLTFSPDCV